MKDIFYSPNITLGKNKDMKWKIFTLGVGIFCIVLFLAKSCAEKRPISMQQQVGIGFNDVLPEAADDFCKNTHKNFLVLEEEIDQGTDEMQTSMRDLLEKLDGYFQRGESDAEREKLINDWIRNEFNRFLVPAVNQFYEAYRNDVEDLESRLLVKTATIQWLADLENQTKQKSDFVTKIPIKAKDFIGNAAIKITDDAAGFIPVVGDAYDIFKTIIYDKRMEVIKGNADEYVAKVRKMLHEKFLYELAMQMPRREEVIAECQKKFNASVAADMAAKERQ